MTAHHQTHCTSPGKPTEIASASAMRLQSLLDSFSGKLNAYQLDWPANPMHVISWGGLVESETILPELDTACRHFIERRLGYLPPDSIIQSQAGYLRALLRLQQSSLLSEEEFTMQADQCLKTLRNLDMQVPLTGEVPLTEAMPWYEQYLPVYGAQARARLTRLLKEPPALEHSLTVELWLRQVLAQDGYSLPEEETAIDRKAVMLVTYRKTLALHGRQAANDMPLPVQS